MARPKEKNTMVIRADGEIFIPELNIFKEKNDLITYPMPEITRELGKLMRGLRIKGKLKREEIKFW